MKNTVPFSNFLPNIITIASVCAGLTGIRYALDDKWQIAVMLVVIAGLLDLFDGRLARILGVTSNFGAQLDSLADFVNYGTVPPIILYLWSLKYITIRGLGWGFVLFFAVCCIIRLARFNCESGIDQSSDSDTSVRVFDSDDPENVSNIDHDGGTSTPLYFFKGLPSTVGGSLLLLPLVISLEIGVDFSHSWALAIGVYSAIISILMPSKLPTPSTKNLAISRKNSWKFLVFAGVFVCSMIMEPLLTVIMTSVSYIAYIPITVCKAMRHNAFKLDDI